MCYTNPLEASNQTMLKHTELSSAFPNNSKTGGEGVKNEEKEYDAIELADVLCDSFTSSQHRISIENMPILNSLNLADASRSDLIITAT